MAVKEFTREYWREWWQKGMQPLLAFIGAVSIYFWFYPPFHTPDRCRDLEIIQNKFEALEQEIKRFHDGSSDWKDVVAEVEKAADKVKIQIENCQCENDPE